MANLQPRRRSIFGGLLLILLGVYFLLGNLRPEWNLWEAFGRYWPVLLILWGLAKLVDHLSARQAGQPAPRTLTVGEFFLVLLLVMLGGAYTATRELPWDDWGVVVNVPWLETHSFTEEVSPVTVPADARVTIRAERGDVEVRAEDVAEIRVVAKKTGRFSNDAQARRWAEAVRVEIAEGEGGYVIRPRYQGRRESAFGVRRRRGAVNLEIVVPRQASVSVHTGTGDVRANGIAGALTVETARGDLEVRDATGGVNASFNGRAEVSNVRGEVRLRGRGGPIEIADVTGTAILEGSFFGPIVLRNVSDGAQFVSSRTNATIGPLAGQFEIRGGRLQASGVAGDLKLITSSYDITLENVSGRVEVENRNGNVELRLPQPPRSEIRVRNERGHIELELPASAGFEVAAFTRRGEIHSEFEGPALKLTEGERDAELQGRVGARGPQLRLETTYGTIRLRKGS